MGDDAIYLAIALRNAGSGIGVLHGWSFSTVWPPGASEYAPLEEFHRLTRDIYVPAGDVGFWQGAFRDPAAPEFAEAAAAITGRQATMVDLLYGDNEGGQRVISRFSMVPRHDGGWLIAAGRHWNVDRDDPR